MSLSTHELMMIVDDTLHRYSFYSSSPEIHCSSSAGAVHYEADKRTGGESMFRNHIPAISNYDRPATSPRSITGDISGDNVEPSGRDY